MPEVRRSLSTWQCPAHVRGLRGADRGQVAAHIQQYTIFSNHFVPSFWPSIRLVDLTLQWLLRSGPAMAPSALLPLTPIEPAPQPPANLNLPRILCLHGGGTNADIFRNQARAMIASLSSSFRLVFADAPHYCNAGPGVDPVYTAWGPFRRWLRWKPAEHAEMDDDSASGEILYCIARAMDEDAGSGEWVGLLGFSQGAKLAASLLYDLQQRRRQKGSAWGSNAGGEEDEDADWRFAVVMAARCPLVALSEHGRHPACVGAGGVGEGFECDGATLDEKLNLPTVHVHGLRDPGLGLHRRMMDEYCEAGSVTLVEWDGGHRLPLRSWDVARVCEAIYKVASAAGVRF